jgi:hypothetical protein
MPSSATTSLSAGGHARDGVVDYSDRAVDTDLTRAPIILALPDSVGHPLGAMRIGSGLAGGLKRKDGSAGLKGQEI